MMHRPRRSSQSTAIRQLVLFIATCLGPGAFAESPDPSGQYAQSVRVTKSRAEVVTDFQEARRSGALLAPGEGGTEFDRNPHSFPPRRQASQRSRDEVRAETLEAIANGDVGHGELNLSARQLFPQDFQRRRVVPGMPASGTVRPGADR